MTFALDSRKKKGIAILLVFAMAFSILASSLSFSSQISSSKATSSSVVSSEFKGAEMQLAQVIYKYGKKNKKITWNESQKRASKIVNLVITGSDIASAISIVLGFLSFGIVTAIAWAARMTLKWYIKKKGRQKAVTW
ncbi:uberolysin/carnocyclin family circular bacteriocin [Siminovitchia sediminis]|uniref:Uberolysin/carnocyclin family circular bacteriocin n=1 Tax=Siminovitchia sediminis TaxID=1274353 RepID=A0ABW4KFF3_9BACI